MRSITLKDWEFNQGDKTSSLLKEFSFETRQHALIFINIIKDKCDEINHHPEWSLYSNDKGDNILRVFLTTHDQNNIVSSKDYELASFMSYNFQETSSYNYKYNRRIQSLISSGFSIATAILFMTTLYYFYIREKNFIVGSRDFYFSKRDR